jgi:hypothetical protein
VKKERSSVERSLAILKGAKVGLSVAELCRQVRLCEQTFYRCKK